MKKTLLLAITALALNLKSVAQAPTYVENFDSTLSNTGEYPRVYKNNTANATIAISKPTASELSFALTNVNGYQNSVGFNLGTTNAEGDWEPLNLVGKSITVSFMLKATQPISILRIELTDTATSGRFLVKLLSVPGGNVYTRVEHTFTPEEVALSRMDLTAVDGLLLNFNPQEEPVNSTVTFDMISVGRDITTATLAAEVIGNSKVYPNPSSNLVYFESGLSSDADVKVSLCDMVGKEVASYNNGKSNVIKGSFDVSNLEKGLYNLTYGINGSFTKAELLMVK
ncbi:MAG TPA: T9SS type A sorting domain-containing protein [Cytophagaceae bacterium]|jgi:hypothetical protein